MAAATRKREARTWPGDTREEIDRAISRGWQLRAHAALGQLLDRGHLAGLPQLDWAVASVGARIIGRALMYGPEGTPDELREAAIGQRRQAAVDAWAAELVASPKRRQHLTSDGRHTLTYEGKVPGADQLVTVVLVANWWEDEPSHAFDEDEAEVPPCG